MASLKARVALVTGGSRGIGRAVAISLAEAGAAVAVNYLEKATEARNVVEAIRGAGGLATAVAADVSKAVAVSEMMSSVTRELGPIDILVNNAGIGIIRGIEDLTEEDFDRTIAVNLKSAFLCTRPWCRACVSASGAGSSTSRRVRRAAQAASGRTTTRRRPAWRG
jgi:3-oxoacyl-[acyl-carrier protein] reductase